VRALVRITAFVLLLTICLPILLAVTFALVAITVPPVRHICPSMLRDLDFISSRYIGSGSDLFRQPSLLGAGLLSLVPLLFLIIVVFALVRLLKGKTPTGREEQAMKVDETRVMQEIYRGLADLEKRVESLETILLETRRPAG